MHQHIARAARAAAIARVGLPAIHIHAIGVGHAHAQALRLDQVRRQTHRGGLAVGASHRYHRDASCRTVREHLVNHGIAHITTLAIRRADVHAQTGRRIDFDNAPTLFFEGTQDRLAHDIDTADVQAHHLGGFDHTGGHFRVHIVGDIGGAAACRQVGVVAQNDAAAFDGHRFGL